MKKLALIATLSVVGIANVQAADGTITINGLVTDKTGAKNVDVQLLGDNNQAIPVLAAGASGAQSNSQWVDVVEGGTADLNYYAEYYATGASTAGQVNTSVQYTIIYQ
jgi:type 1 fimbria pilin